VKKIIPATILISFLVLISSIVLSFSTKAQTVDYEFMFLMCDPNEEEVTCRYNRRLNWWGPAEGCKNFEVSSSYRMLTGQGNVWEGIKIYCYDSTLAGGLAKEYSNRVVGFLSKIVVPLIVLTILVELPIFFAAGFRTRKSLGSAMAINFISVPFAHVFMFLLPVTGLLVLLPVTLLVILFEAGFLVAVLKGLSVKRIFYTSAVANFVSAVTALAATVVLGAF
jgi:hypothetical protein